MDYNRRFVQNAGEIEITMENMHRPGGKDYLHVNDNKILKVDKEYIEYLKSLAQKDKERKCTMCLHNDIREHVHEMINVYPKGAYVRPHSHPLKTETKIILEGKLQVVIFESSGKIMDEFIMGTDSIFTFRLDKGIIHTNIPLTDVVFHEITEGPYIGKDDSVFPNWAPEPNDVLKTVSYMEELKQQIKVFAH